MGQIEVSYLESMYPLVRRARACICPPQCVSADLGWDRIFLHQKRPAGNTACVTYRTRVLWFPSLHRSGAVQDAGHSPGNDHATGKGQDSPIIGQHIQA